MNLFVSFLVDYPSWQMQIFFNIIGEDFTLYLFLHNKDQMYLPKINGVFGSDFEYLKVDRERMRDRNSAGCHIYTFYEIEQTQWKALDMPEKRCKSGNREVNMTQCITQYLENRVGCSMGLARSDPQINRYYDIQQ